MYPKKHQFLPLVAMFCFGFFFQDFISDGPVVDDVYYLDTPELLQCTINIDCDTYYDWKILFLGQEVPDNKSLLEYQGELKYNDDSRSQMLLHFRN